MLREISNSLIFNQEYYETRNYVDYLHRRDRYIHTAKEVVDLLTKINVLNKHTSEIIDFGCAVGFFMEGLAEAGCRTVLGCDISEWAIEQAGSKGLTVTKDYKVFKGRPDVLFALDTFEHMFDSSIEEVIKHFRPKAMVIRIPVSIDNGHTFHLPVSNNDPSHINCKTKVEWESFFKDFGYRSLRLNTYSIYDSEGVYCALLI